MGYTYYEPLKVWLDPASIADVVAYIQTYLTENPISDEEDIENIVAEYIAAHPEIIGGVQSVNSKTGDVVLTASDINTTGSTTIQAVLTALSGQISEIVQTITGLDTRVTANATGITNEATARANADTALGDRITALQGAVGSPLVAATAAAMTDTTKIYVYTGSESGYTNGNWYYYNGSAWTSGGVYNATAINTDTTLTVAGMAADAKATGDGLNDLKSNINQYLYGGEKTFSVTAGANNVFEFPLLKGESYRFYNNSGGTCNVMLLKSDGTTKTISGSLGNGASIGFVPDAEDYIAIRSWIPGGATGTITIESYYSILDSKNAMQSEINEKMNKVDFADGDVIFSKKQFEINSNLNNQGNITYIWNQIAIKQPINQYEMIGIKCDNVVGNVVESPFYVYLYDADQAQISSRAYALSAVKNWLLINPPSNAKYFTIQLYVSQTGGLVDTSAVFTNICVCKSKNGKTIIKDDSAPLPYLPYPYYFKDSYLENKVNTILQKMEAATGNYDAFIFCTDQHWRNNAKQSPKLINYISECVCIPRMFMGGDYEDGLCFSAYKAFRHAYSGKIYNIMGNHEYMDGQIDEHGYWTSRTNTDATLWACLNANMYDAVIGSASRNYYYVDDAIQKTRYIVLSIYTDESSIDFSAEQQAWLQNTALDLPTGYTAIIFAHHIATVNHSTGALTFPAFAQTICNIVDNYSGAGEIACLIGGHTHFDGLGATPGGVPVFVTSCDKNVPYSQGVEEYLENRVTGTIDEQVFDVFIINKTSKKVTAVRVGCPAYNPAGEPLQIREATY